MRILVLLNRIPYPLNDGGAIGSYQFVNGYAQAGQQVYCLAMNTTKHPVDMAATGDTFNHIQQFITVNIDNRIKPLDALLNLLSTQSYIVSRFESKAYRAALIKLLSSETFDVIHLDGLPLCLYIDTIRALSKAKLVYRAHNVEYKIWERGAAAAYTIKHWYLQLQAGRLRTFEAKMLAAVDRVLAISIEDNAFIHAIAPTAKTIITPAGIDIDDSLPIAIPQELSLFFIGSLDWLPNLQGLDWFISDIWPAINRKFPALKFHIAGKKMPSHFYEYASSNIIVHGEVASAREFINQHTVLLSPLVSGSGVRIKIIEAMALGKVVISTTVSAEGLGAIDGHSILIANNIEDFLVQLQKLMDRPMMLQDLSRNAHTFAVNHFQNSTIMARLIQDYTS